MDSVHAGVASVMCSYNRINNTYGCENSKLMNGILKGELDFDGFVLLDWNAQHNLNSANAGLDMLMPLGGSWGQNLTDAVNNGTVSDERVTDMAMRYELLKNLSVSVKLNFSQNCCLVVSCRPGRQRLSRSRFWGEELQRASRSCGRSFYRFEANSNGRCYNWPRTSQE